MTISCRSSRGFATPHQIFYALVRLAALAGMAAVLVAGLVRLPSCICTEACPRMWVQGGVNLLWQCVWRFCSVTEVNPLSMYFLLNKAKSAAKCAAPTVPQLRLHPSQAAGP